MAAVSLEELQRLIDEADLITPEEAAKVADVSIRTIYRRIADEKLKAVTTAAGILVSRRDARNVFLERVSVSASASASPSVSPSLSSSKAMSPKGRDTP